MKIFTETLYKTIQVLYSSDQMEANQPDQQNPRGKMIFFIEIINLIDSESYISY